MKMKPKREKMQIETNTGQWHSDIARLHTYSNKAWTIILANRLGHYDSDTGIYIQADITVTVMPTRSAVLKNGLAAFTGSGEKANLVMRNVAL